MSSRSQAGSAARKLQAIRQDPRLQPPPPQIYPSGPGAAGVSPDSSVTIPPGSLPPLPSVRQGLFPNTSMERGVVELRRIAEALEKLTIPGSAGVVGWTIPIRIARVHPDAALPYRAHESDAGYDLAVCEPTRLLSGQDALLRTGLHFEIPDGWWAHVLPRGSTQLYVKTGVFDAGFRGELLIRVQNPTPLAYEIARGARIAQIVFHDVVNAEWEEVSEDQLSPSDRGEGAFGSSGE